MMSRLQPEAWMASAIYGSSTGRHIVSHTLHSCALWQLVSDISKPLRGKGLKLFSFVTNLIYQKIFNIAHQDCVGRSMPSETSKQSPVLAINYS